jgi:flagellar hook-length control protein FliK
VKEDSPVSDMIKPPADMPAELIGERSSDITRPVPAKAAETLSAEETVLATERQVEPKKIVQAKKTEETGGDLPQFKAVAQAPSKAEPARLAEVRPEAGVRRKEVIDQVMTAMRGAQLRNQSEVRVRLEPQELGEVWIKVTNQGGTLAADFKVTTDFARAAIVEKLPELRQGLVDQGIKVSTMTCDLGQTMGGQSGQSHDRRDYRPVYQNFLRDHTPAVREIPRAKAYASTGLDMIA